MYYFHSLHLRRRLSQMLGHGLHLDFGGLHGHTLGQTALNVLQKSGQSGSGQLVEMHEPEVGSDFIVNTVLLVNVHGLEQYEAIVERFSEGPAVKYIYFKYIRMKSNSKKFTSFQLRCPNVPLQCSRRTNMTLKPLDHCPSAQSLICCTVDLVQQHRKWGATR